MSRRSSVVLLGALFLVGAAAGIVVAGGAASSDALHAASRSETTTRVAVIATDSKFRLSKRSAPTGMVIFTVTNEGKVSHDFKIAGKKTAVLTPRHSATLRVTFSKKGRYPYLSTVPGQATAGMKGTFVVVATPTPPVAPPPTTTTPPTVGTANTTVTVDMFDSSLPGFFKLSQTTIPSGMVTFVITNKCASQCSFDLEGSKAGAILEPGQSETWTVALAPGFYRFHCDVLPAMMGGLYVTA
jgi:uncharacterized cupredoxin-like copper-binding protein